MDLVPQFKGKAAPPPPAGAVRAAPPFRPFKPGEFVQNADGTRSTERTITWQTPEGRWVNTPTLFQTPNGVLDLSKPEDNERAVQAAQVLMRSGMVFPTFDDEQAAVAAAQARSDAGGADAK